MIAPALLDTDTLSGIMRQNAIAVAHASSYVLQYSRLTFSLITRYEILRGLYAKSAATQIAAFNKFCSHSIILGLDDAIVVRAAQIYADLRQLGQFIGDADILIAATAMQHNLVLVTNNTKHFKQITGLKLQNWVAEKP